MDNDPDSPSFSGDYSSGDYGSADSYYVPFKEENHVQEHYPPLKSAPFFCLPKCRDAYRDEYINRRIKMYDTISYGNLTAQQREGIAYYESIMWRNWSAIDSSARLFTMGAAVANARKVSGYEWLEAVTDLKKFARLARLSVVRAAFLYPLGMAFGFTFGHNLSERQTLSYYLRDPVMKDLLAERVEYEKKKRELLIKAEKDIEAAEKALPVEARSSMITKARRAVDEVNDELRKEYNSKRGTMTGDVDPVKGVMTGGWDDGTEAEESKKVPKAEEQRYAWPRDLDSSLTKASDPLPKNEEQEDDILSDVIGGGASSSDADDTRGSGSSSSSSSTGLSSWDRIRKQNAQKGESESAWNRTRKQASAPVSDEDRTSNEVETERQRAQREFEANLERERRLAAGENGGWKD